LIILFLISFFNLMKKKLKPEAGQNSNEELKFLAETEPTFSEFLSIIPDMICIVRDGVFIKLNNSWKDTLGYDQEELLLRSITDFLHPEDIESTFREIDKQLKGLETKAFTNRYRAKDGTYRFLEWRAKAALDGQCLYGVARDVTDRIKAEQALMESEEKYEAAFRTSPDSVNINKMDGTYVDISEGFTAVTGFTREDVIGKKSTDLGIWADEAARYRMVAEVKRTGSMYGLETEFCKKDGTTLTGLMSASLITIDNEPHILTVTRDITSRKKTEQMLRESENRFRQIAESSADWIWEVDANGKYTYCSEKVSSFLGFTVDEVVGKKHFYDFFDPGTRDELKEKAFGGFRRKENIRNFINRNLAKDGRIVILETNGSPVIGKDGEVVGYRGTDRDITERVKAENSLRESEEKYRLLAVNSSDVIWTMNIMGQFTYVSPSVEQLRGYTAEEVMKQGIEESLTPESAAIARQSLATNLPLLLLGAKIDKQTLILEQPCKDGSKVWTELTIGPMYNDNKQLIGFVGITRDIRERRKAEEQLLRRGAALESASDAIVITDQAGMQIYQNKAMTDLFGYETITDLQEAGGVFSRIHDERMARILMDRVGSGETISEELEMKTRSGVVFPAEVRINTILGEKNEKIGTLFLISDITKRIMAEEERRTSEEIFRSLAEYSPNMIVITIKNKIYFVNQICERKLGYSKDEFYHPDFEFTRLAAPEHTQLVKDNAHTAEMGKEIEPHEFIMIHKDGHELFTMVNSKLIQIGDENAVLGVIMDISEQRWAEEILKKKATQFEHFNSLMVERELKLVELKKEVNALAVRLGEIPRYEVS
jgi:PAS domain S-box-containing protein